MGPRWDSPAIGSFDDLFVACERGGPARPRTDKKRPLSGCPADAGAGLRPADRGALRVTGVRGGQPGPQRADGTGAPPGHPRGGRGFRGALGPARSGAGADRDYRGQQPQSTPPSGHRIAGRNVAVWGAGGWPGVGRSRRDHAVHPLWRAAGLSSRKTGLARMCCAASGPCCMPNGPGTG